MNLNIYTQILGVLSFGMAALFCLRTWRQTQGIWSLLGLTYVLLMIEVLSKGRHHLSSQLKDLLRDIVIHNDRIIPSAIAGFWLLVSVLMLLCWWFVLRVNGWPSRVAVLATMCIFWLGGIEITSLRSVENVVYATMGPVYFIGIFWLLLAVCVALCSRAALQSS